MTPADNTPVQGDALVERLRRRATYDYMAMSLRKDVCAAALSATLSPQAGGASSSGGGERAQPLAQDECNSRPSPYPCEPKPFDTMMGTVMMCAKCGHGPAPKECTDMPPADNTPAQERV